MGRDSIINNNLVSYKKKMIDKSTEIAWRQDCAKRLDEQLLFQQRLKRQVEIDEAKAEVWLPLEVTIPFKVEKKKWSLVQAVAFAKNIIHAMQP